LRQFVMMLAWPITCWAAPVDCGRHMVIVNDGRQRIVDLRAKCTAGGADNGSRDGLDSLEQASAQGVVVHRQIDLDGSLTGLTPAHVDFDGGLAGLAAADLLSRQ
jgi:hypothetical protein